MLSLLATQPLAFFIVFPGVLMTITLHEFAHSWTAYQLGDPTPKAKGRLTLDPRKHLDPLGVIVILLTNFGWGKPAPYDPYNLKEPVRDSALIAVSGAVVNLLTALVLALVLRFISIPISWVADSVGQLFIINIYLAIFNLIPVKPLDGSKVLVALLPRRTAVEYNRFMDRYGLMVLILLLLPIAGGQSPVLMLIQPIASLLVKLMLG